MKDVIKSLKYQRKLKIQGKKRDHKAEDKPIIKHGKNEERVYPKGIFVTANLEHEQ